MASAAEEAELQALLAENAALKARAAPHVEERRRRGIATLHRLGNSSCATASDTTWSDLQAAAADLKSVLTVHADDEEVKRCLQEIRALRERRHVQRKLRPVHEVHLTAAVQSSRATSRDRPEPRKPTVARLTVAEIRKIARKAKTEFASAPAAAATAVASEPQAAQQEQSTTNPAVEFGEDQIQAFNAITRGENCFITGPAGSGKSYVIQRAVAALRANGKQVRSICTCALLVKCFRA